MMPHAVMFPYPVQGHMNPMIQLAKKLISKGFVITFINTVHNHSLILKNGASDELMSLPNLHFVQILDGLPSDHGRVNQDIIEYVTAVDKLQEGPFQRLMETIMASSKLPPVTCLISDAYLSWMQKVADEFCIPRVALWTNPVHANMALFYQPLLMSKGLIPYKGKEAGGSNLVTCIPGVVPLHISDLPSVFEEDNFIFRWILNAANKHSTEALWNLGNSFYELEYRALDAFRQEAVNSFIPVGPLLPSDFISSTAVFKKPYGTSLWEEDSSCEHWLDKQKPGSVLYISFGSIVNMSQSQARELALGLEASQQPFLWALRPDVAAPIIENFQGSTCTDRALIVPWAPQLLVLSHPAVGALLTHCGWNSLLESMCAGVPILAWPGGFSEQNMNGRYVVDEWKVGMECKTERADGLIEREEVARVIKALMGGSSQGEAIRKAIGEVREKARESTLEGSSRKNLELFVEDMKRRAGDH